MVYNIYLRDKQLFLFLCIHNKEKINKFKVRKVIIKNIKYTPYLKFLLFFKEN